MDATRMSFRDNSFDVSIDKGTYDALAVRSVTLLTCIVRPRIQGDPAQVDHRNAARQFEGSRAHIFGHP